MSFKTTVWLLHVVHLSSEPPVFHLQLNDAPTQQVGLLLHQLQVDSDLRLARVGGVSHLMGVGGLKRTLGDGNHVLIHVSSVH